MAETQVHGHAQTRQRLLEAAAEVFVEKGYRSATIREICEKAGANIAAVNYHFGDKFTLYRELLLSEPAKSFARHPQGAWKREGMTPEQMLESFIADFLTRLMDPEKPAWHAILMTREMADPTEALDAMVEQFIRPQSQALAEIIRAIAGQTIDPEALHRCTGSIISQIVFHLLCRKVTERIHPERKYDAEGIRDLANHIATFSIAGIHAVAAKKG